MARNLYLAKIMANKFSKILSYIRVRLLYAFAFVFLLSVILVCILRWINPPTSSFMLQHLWRSDIPLQYQWVPSDKISKHLAIAAVASEDQRFPVHFGFDLHEIQLAIRDKAKGKSLRGASTITQQVAKNIFLWKGKSLFRKSVEAYFTVLIELCWSKSRILEVYLNIAEMGAGIYGAQAASRHYYNKDAWQLGVQEATQLIAALPNPNVYRVNPPSPYIIKRSMQIQRQIKLLGGFNYLSTKKEIK